MNEFSYNLNFYKHVYGGKNHKISQEEQRLKQILNTNFFKSFIIFNTVATYLLYIKKQRSLLICVSCI